jgi:uncharacterized 2Fe-2S/4Fe-4S cluster protein (DUF4445 family)
VPGKPPTTPSKRTLFDDADVLALRVPTSCRRTGRCRECVIEVKTGAEHLCAPTAPESFLRAPFRLACQAAVDAPGAVVDFEVVRRRLRIVVPEPEQRDMSPEPAVRVVDGVVHWHDEEIEPEHHGVYGLAIDVGTTTVAFELVDLTTGRTVEVVAFENPQRFGGSDVMNRISYDATHRGELRQALRRAVNGELRELYARTEISRRSVYEVVVVGNSTMRDIFFDLDVSSIGERPYKSQTEHELLSGERTSTELVRFAWELGLKVHPRARVWGVPLIASHVGADVAADLVATGLGMRDGVEMLVDVGTNTEVVIAAGDRIVAASCPAGPAFEGGEITYGMQAADGAIESIRSNGDGFHLETIGGGPPQGICGSGLIDLVAELLRSGRMTPKGVFADRGYTIDVAPGEGISFTRADASALAQAKAANTVGQWILLRKLGIDAGDVDRLFLAGGFATYVNVRNAIEIGFLAPVAQDRVAKVGNAALRGARELLLSTSARDRLRELIARVEHVELETTPDFFELFVDGCQFKPLPQAVNGDGRVAV